VTAGLLGAGGVEVMVDSSGSVLAPPSSSSVTPPNMETPPTGGFPLALQQAQSA